MCSNSLALTDRLSDFVREPLVAEIPTPTPTRESKRAHAMISMVSDHRHFLSGTEIPAFFGTEASSFE